MKKNEIIRFAKSFKYASEGIFGAINKEPNMKIHIITMIIVIICGILLKISKIEWVVCVLLFGIVIAAELINTAIENTVDLITEEKNPKAKTAKDTAAGAVLVIAIVSAIIGCLIFIPKVFYIFEKLGK